VILPGGGYAPSDHARPGTPPAGPAGAITANPAAPRTGRDEDSYPTGISHATINPKEQGGSSTMTHDDTPWTLGHQPHILMQMEARPGPAAANGTRWVERRLTGLGIALCSCGHTTGLVPSEQLPDTVQFAREHPPFTSAALAAATEGAAP
jgi:hypothetical protein